MDRRVAAVATFVLLSATWLGARAASFAVGDQKGWIVPNDGLNYTTWARNITAHVGDSLYFKYNPNAHNVLKVSGATYATCNVTAPSLQIWDNGDTTVMLEEAGTHYFICGAPSHCVMGQAFALEVSPAPSDATPSGPSVLSPPGPDDSGAPLSCRPRHPWVVLACSLAFFHVSRL